MKKNILIALPIILLSIFIFWKFEKKQLSNTSINETKRELLNFALYDHLDNFHELYNFKEVKALVIISQGNDCPINQKYSKTIDEISKRFELYGFKFLLLNSNVQDSKDAIAEEAKKYSFNLPILIDPSQVIASYLGITRTSEALVIDPNGWKLLYRGAIDDRIGYGVDKQISKNDFLINVLNAINEKREININAQPAKGCLITFNEPKSLDYQKAVAPILKNKCLNCHSVDNSISPKLSDYMTLKKWGELSLETILTDKMPPDQNVKGSVHSLSVEEKRILVMWYLNGMPNDDLKNDPILNYKINKK